MTRREPAVRQLEQDLATGRIAQAYLFTGEAGEQEVAWFAEALLCKAETGPPCGVCPSCRAFERGAHPDLHTLEPEGKVIKLEQVRGWQPFFRYRPGLGKRQVFRLHRPELLTAEAANSLLKILEEPLPETVFLLTTADLKGVLPTIRSRCRVVHFRRSEEAAGTPDLGEQAAELERLLQGGSQARLLHQVRLTKPDRAAARELLEHLLGRLEDEYRRVRERMRAGEGGLAGGQEILGCLEILQEGLQRLEENANVQLLLSLTMRRVQLRLRKWPGYLAQDSRK